MNRDLTGYDDVIDLLVLWHRLESPNLVRGYPVECPTTAGWKASTQYDDFNGAQETSMRAMAARRVGFLVGELPEPKRTALAFLARNRATGISVWISPKLPTDKVERANLIADALADLMECL